VETEAFVLSTVAWGLFALFVVGAVAGTILIERTYRLALAVFAVATVSGFIFSFLAGFSIGRFTALLPMIVTAFAVTKYRDLRLQVTAQVAAIGIYVLLAWILAGQIYFWGIQIELPLSVAAYALALVFPPGREPARA
jgi:hypothetical protein